MKTNNCLFLVGFIFSFIIFWPQIGLSHGSGKTMVFIDWNKANAQVIQICSERFPETVPKLKLAIVRWENKNKASIESFISISKEIIEKDLESYNNPKFKRSKPLENRENLTESFIAMLRETSFSDNLKDYCQTEHGEMLSSLDYNIWLMWVKEMQKSIQSNQPINESDLAGLNLLIEFLGRK